MTQGVFIGGRRPKSKKEIKDTVAAGQAARVSLESTSMFGNEYDGPITEMPEGRMATFVGPDPYRDRKFYGNIIRTGDKIKVT